jgi:hypothetical protein
VNVVIAGVHGNGELRVDVTSELGSFSARWDGAAPAIGARLAVELGFPDRFTWGVDIVRVDTREHAIEPGLDGGVVLWATLERFDEDGAADLRCGGSVLALEVFGDPPAVGATVRIEARTLTLYDSNI